jgi:hypothetical protein
MKKSFLKVLAVVALVSIAYYTVYAAGVNKNLSVGLGQTLQKTTGTYAASQVDTITFSRDANCQAYAFAMSWADSVKITTILLKRVINGVEMAQVTTDSLVASAGFSSTAAVGLTKAITLAPLADQYRIYITYNASDNGVTSATNAYEVLKQYSK